MSPSLLYVYPWMPYPRRVLIYLREHNISASIVTVVPISDPGQGDKAAEGFPDRPLGSLPILAVPPTGAEEGKAEALDGWTLIRQSVPIMQYLQRMIVSGGEEEKMDSYIEACEMGYLISAETVMTAWNGVRLFGSGVGAMNNLEAAKESLKWVHRELAGIERHLEPSNGMDTYAGGFKERLADGGAGPSFGDVALFSFLELVDDLYACFEELTMGKGEGKDAYGRNVERVGWYPRVRDFYGIFRERESVRREASTGEEVSAVLREKAGTWADGVWDP